MAKSIVRLIAFIVLVPLVLFLFVRPLGAGDVQNLLISNVRDTSFTVSWLTAADEAGQVQLIGGKSFPDDRGANFNGMTHYVTVTGLKANTDYQFDILSGSTTNDNNGAHFAVKTGASLSPHPPDVIVGRVRNPDGSNATNAIVVVTLQHEQVISEPLSMLLTERDGGFFHIDLSDVRVLKDPSRFLNYGTRGDLLTIQAIDPRGMGLVKVDVGDPRLRASDPNQTLLIQLGSGSQPPPTVVRLPTPTPIPTTTPQESSVLLIGIVAAAVVVIGIVAVAIMFVWKR